MNCTPYSIVTRFPVGTINQGLRLLYAETSELDLAALQVAGVVTVANFFAANRFIIGAGLLVTETVEDDAANDGFVVTDLWTLPVGGVAGMKLGSEDYVATADQIIAPLLPADVDLEITTNNVTFVAGKVKVGYWYFAVS